MLVYGLPQQAINDRPYRLSVSYAAVPPDVQPVSDWP